MRKDDPCALANMSDYDNMIGACHHLALAASTKPLMLHSFAGDEDVMEEETSQVRSEGMEEVLEEEEEEEEITQEDTWAVISAYFEQKGLVRQQLDSFDSFIQNTMQELVDESPDIVLQPEAQHKPGAAPQAQTRYVINFGQIYLSRPTMTEADGSTSAMLPNEARLRNLTYVSFTFIIIFFWDPFPSLPLSPPPFVGAAALLHFIPVVSCTHASTDGVCCSYSAPLFVDMSCTTFTSSEDSEPHESHVEYPRTFIGKVRQLHVAPKPFQ